MLKAGQKIITIYILPNISRVNSNQIIKFGQLIEYNMINIILTNNTQNLVKKLVSDPFIKNQN